LRNITISTNGWNNNSRLRIGSLVKNGFVALLGALSFVYLLNPTMGVFELLPDALPIVGNLDEATATAVLLAALAHFGFDLGGVLRRFGLGTRAASKPADRAASLPDQRPVNP